MEEEERIRVSDYCISKLFWSFWLLCLFALFGLGKWDELVNGSQISRERALINILLGSSDAWQYRFDLLLRNESLLVKLDQLLLTIFIKNFLHLFAWAMAVALKERISFSRDSIFLLMFWVASLSLFFKFSMMLTVSASISEIFFSVSA